MKDPAKMTDAELTAEYNKTKDPAKMTDAELKAEYERINPTPTLEDSMGFNDVVYPALHAAQDTLSTVALPITMPIAGVGYLANRASNFMQGNEQEPDIDPLEHPLDFTNKYATTGAITRTLPQDNNSYSRPIADSIPQSDDLDALKKQFPNAYNAIKGISQKDIDTSGMDAAVMGEAPSSIARAPKVPIMPLETAADYVRSLAKGEGQLRQLEASGKVYAIADMVRQNPDAYFHPFQPNKIYSYLMGSLDKQNATRDFDSGAIRQATANQNVFLDQVHNNNLPVNRADLQQAALDKLSERAIKSPGNRIETGQRTAVEKLIRANIPVSDDARMNLEPSNYSSETRRFANTLKEPYMPGTSSADVKHSNLAGSVMEAAARDAENAAIDRANLNPDDVAAYRQNNADISRMLTVRDLMEGNLTNDSGELGNTIGNTRMGNLKGGVVKSWDRYIKPLSAKAGSTLINSAPDLSAGAAQLSPAANVFRRPNSTDEANSILEKNMQGSSNIDNYVIPRSSEEILNQKDMVANKIHKELGPNGVKMFQQSLSNPKALAMALRQMELVKPQIFQADDYGRFDGEIDNPVLKQKAMENILNNQPSALEGAKEMQLLLNGNKYYGG